MIAPLYHLSEIEKRVNQNTFWLIRQCEDHNAIKLDYNDTYISGDSCVLFLKWYNKQYDMKIPIPSNPKRAYSTTHRIEIAYKSQYKCNACKVLLPPTFEVDHIVELRDGGKDEYENLQALCPNCHSLKTRANTLKNNKIFEKEFGKRAVEFETNAFDSFKHVKKSKYF